MSEGTQPAQSEAVDLPGVWVQMQATPVTTGLAWVLLSAFLGQEVAVRLWGEQVLALVVVHSERLHWVWTWFTASFVHATPIHIGLNGVFLVLWGRTIEQWHGSRFLAVAVVVTGTVWMLSGTVLAGLVHCGVGATGGCHVGPMGGASGALVGLLGVLTWHSPSAPVTLLPRVSAPLWTFTGGFVAVSLLGIATPIDPMSVLVGIDVAHVHHLAGLGAGVGVAAVREPISS